MNRSGTEVKKNMGDDIDRTKTFPWHTSTKEQCFSELHLDDDVQRTGLTSADASDRLKQYGPNKLTEKEKVTLLQRIWKQVANVLVGILVFVAIVSAVRAATATGEDVVTNCIQVGIIIGVIV